MQSRPQQLVCETQYTFKIQFTPKQIDKINTSFLTITLRTSISIVGHNYLWKRLALHKKKIFEIKRAENTALMFLSLLITTTLFFPKIQENFCAKLRLAEKKYG